MISSEHESSLLEILGEEFLKRDLYRDVSSVYFNIQSIIRFYENYLNIDVSSEVDNNYVYDFSEKFITYININRYRILEKRRRQLIKDLLFADDVPESKVEFYKRIGRSHLEMVIIKYHNMGFNLR